MNSWVANSRTNRPFLCLLLASVILVLCCTSARGAPEQLAVTLVHDGPGHGETAFASQLKQETAKLLAPEISLEWRTEPASASSPEAIQHALNRALGAPGTDIVVTSGPLGTLAAARAREHLAKPVLGLLEVDSSLYGLSQKDPGVSDRGNLNCIAPTGKLQRDLTALRRLGHTSAITCLFDAALLRAVPGFAPHLSALGLELDLQIKVIPVADSPNATIQELRDTAPGALYLGSTPQWGAQDRAVFFRACTVQHWPVVSGGGRKDVVAGALAAHAGPAPARIARRMALNIQAVLQGELPGELPRELGTHGRLCVNASTARHLGIPVSRAAALSAEILHDPPSSDVPRLTLPQALNLAARHNPQLMEQTARVAGARGQSGQARAAFLPQVSGYWQTTHIDQDRSEASLGMQPWRRASAGFTVRQNIFNDPLFTQAAAAEQTVKARKQEQARARLDVLAATGRAYLNVLRAQAVLKSAKRNHALTLDHLELARARRRAGASGPQDIYRWEAQEAEQQSAVLKARTRVAQARLALNRALGQPPQTSWTAADLSLQDRLHFLAPFFPADGAVPQTLQALIAQAEDTALEQSPSLNALEALLHAGRLRRDQKKRAFFAPEITASFEFEHELTSESESWDAPQGMRLDLPQANKDDWTLALRASVPLITGGERGHALAEARAVLARLAARRRGIRQQIQEEVRRAVYALESSRPRIHLARRAADRADKNLHVVQAKYARGTASLVALLDAQHNAVTQQKKADLALYAYFEDLVALQRAMSWFAWTAPQQSAQQWLRTLQRRASKTAAPASQSRSASPLHP